MIFDFRIRVFYTVAEKLSYTKAAVLLNVTQPAVTRHINELEKQLGTALFRRQGNKISLTPAGDLLFQYAGKILALYHTFDVELSDLQDSQNGILQLGASTTITQYILPRILARFRKQNPLVNVSLLNGNTEFIEQQLLNGKIDFGVVEGSSHQADIQYKDFVHDEIVLVTSLKNNKLRQEEISIQQLFQQPLVIREVGSGTLEVIEEALTRQGFSRQQFNIEMQLGSTESIKQYLYNSNAVAFLSIHSIYNELKNNTLRIVDVKGLTIVRTFQFIQLQGNQSSLSDKFMQFCLRYYN
jgi:LysR family transcriptional regulator, transcriptional activator of the cysJI operon